MFNQLSADFWLSYRDQDKIHSQGVEFILSSAPLQDELLTQGSPKTSQKDDDGHVLVAAFGQQIIQSHRIAVYIVYGRGGVLDGLTRIGTSRSLGGFSRENCRRPTSTVFRRGGGCKQNWMLLLMLWLDPRRGI